MIQLYDNNILFKPFMTSGITKGGLIVPDSCQKESSKGKIVKVGDGTLETPMQFKDGQIVFRVKDWGIPVDIEGERHYIMEQSSILSIV